MKYLVKELLKDALKKLNLEFPGNFKLDVSLKPEFGDFSTNIAILLSKSEKKDPHQIALKIVSELNKFKEIDRVEIAGPGFINIFLTPETYFLEIQQILKEGKEYGKNDLGENQKLQVEYISANPTGPLHIGNARGGPIGQVLANVFSFLGYEVAREFYINDIGGQVNRFAETLYYWMAKRVDDRIPFPEGGYPGEYMKEISQTIQEEKKDEIKLLKDKGQLVELFKKEGLRLIIKKIRDDAKLLGIEFDNWVNQSDFEFSGKTDLIVEKLTEKKMTSKKEGALWFKNPDDPDLSDRECVLKKSDEGGSYTYFADDIAYHVDKFDRGYKRIIDVWGANHSGHIPRLKAALKSLDYRAEDLDIILYQYVRLKNAGKVVSMGKRLGNFITIPQILESGVEPDAFKYFIINQNPNTPFDFDLKLAADTSEKNPVFYIKYAHARISSILKKSEREVKELQNVDFSVLKDPKEVALYKEITRLPDILTDISRDLQIQTLPHYIYKIATLFHDFYANCPVLTAENKKLVDARLALVSATRQIIFNGLNICGIEAPEKM